MIIHVYNNMLTGLLEENLSALIVLFVSTIELAVAIVLAGG